MRKESTGPIVQEDIMAETKTREALKVPRDAKRPVASPAKGKDAVRTAVERQLDVLCSPDAVKKLRTAFNATPSELAAAANAAEASRKK